MRVGMVGLTLNFGSLLQSAISTLLSKFKKGIARFIDKYIVREFL